MAQSMAREVLHLSVTRWLATVLVMLAVGAPVALNGSGNVAAPQTPPSPLEPAVPLQEWAADAGVYPTTLATVLRGLPRQEWQKPAEKCDPDLGEHPIDGGCWMKTDVPPPCPPGKLFKHDGICWRPVPRSARPPTTGEPSPLSIADP